MKDLIQKSIIASICAALLFGCSSAPKLEPEKTLATQVVDPAEQLLSLAHAEPNPSTRAELYLQAAELLYKDQLLSQAAFASDSIDPAHLSPQKSQDFYLLKLRIALVTHDNESLTLALENINLDIALRTNLDEQSNIIRSLASGFSAVDRPLEAAVLLSDFSGLFGASNSFALNEETWLLLQRTDIQTLVKYTYSGTNPNTAAWLDLARELKINANSIDSQYQTLAQWLSTHPNHPAAFALPLELDLLAQLPNIAPTRIILALPLSGKLQNIGKAIMDGFLANHYLNHSAELNLRIDTFDTAQNNIDTLYESVSETELFDNKTLIVGPITKADIETLSNNTRITVPTLALNNSENISFQPDLYVFGLTPEQEVEQIASRMIESSHQRIAVIQSEGDRNIKLTDAFTRSLEPLGGHVVANTQFGRGKSVTDAVAEMLSTSSSKLRAREVARITGLQLDSQPRRRNDIDAVLMLADHKHAKQIKPLLAFNFASNVPVYGTSSIHAPGVLDSNNDLSGVEFVDIPWVFTQSSPLKLDIQKTRKELGNRYARFYALGADAYLLAPRLTLLREIPNSHAQGLTGTLQINENGVVSRTLQWAKFNRGKAKTIH